MFTSSACKLTVFVLGSCCWYFPETKLVRCSLSFLRRNQTVPFQHYWHKIRAYLWQKYILDQNSYAVEISRDVDIAWTTLSKQPRCNAFVMQISYFQPLVYVPVPASFCFNHKTFFSSCLLPRKQPRHSRRKPWKYYSVVVHFWS